MATRWILVCTQDNQPSIVDGAMQCASGVVMPVDTVISESSPLLNLGQLLAMTPDDALIISTAIAVLWAVAWGFRAVAQTFFTPERNQDD
jgi:hypothetical protein